MLLWRTAMAVPKKRCETTPDLFAGDGITCGQFSVERFASERELLRHVPAPELEKLRLALSLHPWGNTAEEEIRRDVVEENLRKRQTPRVASPTTKSGIERIAGTDLVKIKRRP
jgi:hypothetical protein